jgi:hypothetical protein
VPPALYFKCVDCVSVDDKGSSCTETEEQMGYRCCGASGDVRETGDLGEEHGSLSGLLELLIVEGQEGMPTTP